MSLINDALKRAAADKPRDAQSTAATPPLQPVDSAVAKPVNILPWALLVVGVGAVGIAAGLWFGSGRNPQQHAALPQAQPIATSPAPVAAPPTVAPAAANPLQQTAKTLNAVTARNAEAKPAPAPAPATPSATTKTPAVVKTAASAPVAPRKTAPAISSEPKPARLQSIFYRMKAPSAIINGKTLGVGDSVDGIKIVSIQRTSVEVVQNGKYRTLTLQD